MDGPEAWRWIWLGVAVLLAVGEMTTPGSFFLLPFALGGAVAAALAFFDASLVVQWTAFVVVSVGSFLGFRPLARRLDRDGHTEGVGSRRLIGQVGTVIEPIEPGGSGLVKIGTEEWRAVFATHAAAAAGERVRVVEVQGTRVVVREFEGDPA